MAEYKYESGPPKVGGDDQARVEEINTKLAKRWEELNAEFEQKMNELQREIADQQQEEPGNWQELFEMKNINKQTLNKLRESQTKQLEDLMKELEG
jgi:predicted phage gp36 major capsid-like protein